MKYFVSIFKPWRLTRKGLKAYSLLESTLVILISTVLMLMASLISNQIVGSLNHASYLTSEFEKFISLRQQILLDKFQATGITIDSNSCQYSSPSKSVKYQLLPEGHLLRLTTGSDTMEYDNLNFTVNSYSDPLKSIEVRMGPWHIAYLSNQHRHSN